MLLKNAPKFSVLLPAMCTIQSYVFLDLETTGIPSKEIGQTKITELSMVGVLRKHLLTTDSSRLPRVLNKLTLTFHPQKHISSGASNVTGLTNELLEEQGVFDHDAFDLITKFLSRLPGPVCFVAHNGNRFDFPILQAQVKYIGREFPETSVCVDSLVAFRDLKVYDIVGGAGVSPGPLERLEEAAPPLQLGLEDPGIASLPSEEDVALVQVIQMEEVTPSVSHEFSSDEELNEEIVRTVDRLEALYGSTPERTTLGVDPFKVKDDSPPRPPPRPPSKRPAAPQEVTPPTTNGESVGKTPTGAGKGARRRLFPDEPLKSKPSYRLGAIYKAFFGDALDNAHSAEADALALVRIVSALGAPFHDWAQANHKKLAAMQRAW